MALLRPTLAILLLACCSAPLAAQVQPQAAAAKPAAPDAAAAVEPTEHPLLWRFEGITTSYLYGTVHVTDRRVLALPAAVTRALDGCGAFYTETPMDEAIAEGERNRLLLPDGETLQGAMPPDLSRRLGAYLASKGYSLEQFERQQLWAVALQAMTLDEVQAEAGTPLDQVVHDLAQRAGKRLEALESFDEQIEPFEELSTDQRLELLRSTLDLLERYETEHRNPTEELVRLYIAGDAEALHAHMTDTFPAGGPLRDQMIELLLERRNVRMAKRIADKLRSDRRTSHFFAIGAGHLGGPRGVLALLRLQGFLPQRVTPLSPAPASTAEKRGNDDLLRAIHDELRNLGRRLDALEQRVQQLEKKQ